MKILKPSWVNHDDLPIFSIDVHPDSSRFATGGQGKDSGTIIIWNMGPIVDKEKENDENAPKILCRMDHHIACVNIVRWSHNGLFLASGSDDKLIMIWQYVHGGSYENIENWKCGFTLRGHSGDVMDLSWSSRDQYLASCSVDNTVIIWNALKFPDIICRINAHAGLVKGVAWDPVGNYLATQSDDKTLKIWKTLDWTLEKCIDEPFKQCTGTTHVLRLNWSPDGQLIISAHAINNGAPTAQVIDRGNKWSAKLDFVGHRKAVTSVRFFPQILKPYNAQQGFKVHSLCALGSRDRSISIWLTNYSRALCAVHDLFDNPIMDLSWSRHPNPGLLACSMDGSVAYIELNRKEIGDPLTKEETEEFFMKKYNYDINATFPLKNQQLNSQIKPSNLVNKKDNDNSVKFIENLDALLALEQQKLNQEQDSKQNLITINNDNSVNNLNSSSSNTPKQSTENNKQIERRLPDGRRRITPICISKPGEYDTPKPFTSLPNSFNKVSIGFESNSITSKTATEQSTIIVEKRDERNEIIEISPVKSIIYSKSTVTSGLNNNNSNDNTSNDTNIKLNGLSKNNNVTCNVEKMEVTITSSTIPNINNKIIIPSVSSLSIPSSALVPKLATPSHLENKTDNQNSAQQHPSARKQLQLSNTPTTTTTNNNNISNTNINKVSKCLTPSVSAKNQINSPAIQNSAKQKINYNQSLSQPQQPTNITVPLQSQSKQATPLKNNHDNLSLSQSHHHHHHTRYHYLNPLKIDENFLTRINRTKTSIEIHNSLNIIDKTIPSYQAQNEIDYQINLVKCLNEKSVKWQIYFYTRICEVAFNDILTAIVCDDATISLIKSSTGTQLCCPIQLESKAAILKCSTNYCMCITINGFVYVWKYNNSLDQSNDQSLSELPILTVVNRQSCENFFRDSKLYGEFSNASLTDSGIPIITMSKSKSYYFSIQTQCWHIIPAIGSNLNSDQLPASHLMINSSSIFTLTSNNIKTSPNDMYGPLNMIQSHSKSSNIVKTIDLLNKTSNSSINKEDFTLTHLESQMNASLGLSSSKEYKFWLLTYTRYLVENDYEEKLTELCDIFLGPLNPVNWSSMILNHKKCDLLQEILAIMIQNLKFQRLYNYYKQQISFINNFSSKKGLSVLDRLNNSTSTRPNNFNINDRIKDSIQAKLDARSSINAIPSSPIVNTISLQPSSSNIEQIEPQKYREKQNDNYEPMNLDQAKQSYQTNEIEMIDDNNEIPKETTPKPIELDLNHIGSNSNQESHTDLNRNEQITESEKIEETNIANKKDSNNDYFKVPQRPDIFKAELENNDLKNSVETVISPNNIEEQMNKDNDNDEIKIEPDVKNDESNQTSNIVDNYNNQEIINEDNVEESYPKTEPATIGEILMM